MKKILIFNMLLVALIVLSSCSANNSITIVTISPNQAEFITQVFNEKYKDKDLKVKSVFKEIEDVGKHWTDLDQVISEYLRENKDVDIVFGFPPEYLNGLVKSNSVKKLDNAIDTKVLKKVAPAIIEPIKEAGNGYIYAVTPTFNSYALAYNKKVFKELGLNPSSEQIYWEDVYKLSQEIQSRSNYKGITLGMPSTDEEYYYLFQIFNRPIYNLKIENNKISINNAINQKYWSLFTKLYLDNDKATEKEFLKGNVGMAVFPAATLMDKEFLEQFAAPDLQIGIMEMPIFSENKGGLAYSDSLFAISTNSNNIKSASEFLEYIQGKEFANYLSSGSYLSSYWDKEVQEQLREKYNFDFSPIYNQRGELLTKPSLESEKFLQIEKIGAKYFTQLLNNDKSIIELLNEYEIEINKN